MPRLYTDPNTDNNAQPIADADCYRVAHGFADTLPGLHTHSNISVYADADTDIHTHAWAADADTNSITSDCL